jgi:hypothetical protein
MDFAGTCNPARVNDDPENEELDGVGFNLSAHKLHCLIVLSDTVAEALSDRAGPAFFRAFVVEGRKTGRVLCNFRYRYIDGDSWYRHVISDNNELAKAPVRERVRYLADAMEGMLTMGLVAALAKTDTVPVGVITRHYPPDPEDGEKTLDWLIEQDLIEVTTVGGRPVGSQSEA